MKINSGDEACWFRSFLEFLTSRGSNKNCSVANTTFIALANIYLKRIISREIAYVYEMSPVIAEEQQTQLKIPVWRENSPTNMFTSPSMKFFSSYAYFFFASRLVQPWSRECEKYQREMGRNTIGRIVNKYKVRRTIIQTLENTKINMKSIILQIYQLLEILRRLPSIYLNCSAEHHLSSLLNIENDDRCRSMNFMNYNILFSISA